MEIEKTRVPRSQCDECAGVGFIAIIRKGENGVYDVITDFIDCDDCYDDSEDNDA